MRTHYLDQDQGTQATQSPPAIRTSFEKSLIEHFIRIRPVWMEGDRQEEFDYEMEYWRNEVREAGYDPDKQFKKL